MLGQRARGELPLHSFPTLGEWEENLASVGPGGKTEGDKASSLTMFTEVNSVNSERLNVMRTQALESNSLLNPSSTIY